MRKKEVVETLTAHRTELRERFGVKSLALFGSVVRDQAGDSSDVDLLVEFDRPIGLFHLIATEQYLERLLRVSKVDLVLRRSVIEELKSHIFQEAVDVLGTPSVEAPPSAHAGSSG